MKQSKAVQLLRERLRYFESQVKQTELAIGRQLNKEAEWAGALPTITNKAKRLPSIKRYAMFNDVLARDRKGLRRSVTVYRDRAPRKANPAGVTRPLSIKVEGCSLRARKLLRLLADRVTNNRGWSSWDVPQKPRTVERFWFDGIPVGALKGKK